MLLALALSPVTLADGLVDELLQRFANSDIELLRAKSNAPLLPLAWVSAADYGDARFTRPNGAGTDLEYDQTTLSQGAFFPCRWDLATYSWQASG
jgi:hypothetical protein